MREIIKYLFIMLRSYNTLMMPSKIDPLLVIRRRWLPIQTFIVFHPFFVDPFGTLSCRDLFRTQKKDNTSEQDYKQMHVQSFFKSHMKSSGLLRPRTDNAK